MVVALVCGLAFAGSWAGTWWLARPDSPFVLLDRPNERSLHERPTPRTGGLAILSGILLAGVVWWMVAGEDSGAGGLGWTLGGMLGVAAVSFVDDRRGVSPLLRLVSQGLAATVAVDGGSVAVRSLELGGSIILDLGPAAVPMAVFALMWMANLYNFMDGMDGFAAGMTASGFAVLAVLFGQAGSMGPAVVAAVVSAASLGFLPYNLPPARIFMGDIGSVPLGFLAAGLSIQGVRDGVFDVWVPLLAFSPFVLDATLTLLKRLVRGAKVWRPHREHYYQRLVLAGLGHGGTLAVEAALMLGSSSAALALSWVEAPAARLAILLAAGFVYASAVAGVRLFERRVGRPLPGELGRTS